MIEHEFIHLMGALDPKVKVVITSGVALLALGLLFVTVLTIAYARLKVEQDSRVEAILEVVPGANCGGCGLAGCNAYCEGVVADHALMGKCGPGGDEFVHQIATILGIDPAESGAPIRPIVHCSAHAADRLNANEYVGVPSCREAHVVTGAIGCPTGCFGMGDCSRVCEFGAMHIIDGLATVDYSRCVGCGACSKACPRSLIEMVKMPEDPLLVIACSSHDKAKEVRGYCQVGCIGCGICAKQAPGAFEVKDLLAIVDYDNYPNAENLDKGTAKCPRLLMVYVGENVETKETPAQESQPVSAG